MSKGNKEFIQRLQNDKGIGRQAKQSHIEAKNNIEFDELPYTPAPIKKESKMTFKNILIGVGVALALYLGYSYFSSSPKANSNIPSNSGQNREKSNPSEAISNATIDPNYINALSRLKNYGTECDYYLLKGDTWQAIIASLQSISVPEQAIGNSGIDMRNSQPDNGLTVVLDIKVCTSNNIQK